MAAVGVNWMSEIDEFFTTVEAEGQKDYFEYFQKMPEDEFFAKELANAKQGLKGAIPQFVAVNPISDPKKEAQANLKMTLVDLKASMSDAENPNKRKETDPEYKGKRNHHNTVEKKRRKKINCEMTALKDLIPYCKDATTNKLTVLQLACKYIQTLHDTQKKLMDQNQKLKEANDQLQHELRDCHKIIWDKEEAVATCLQPRVETLK
eukprot:TRINITY_DN8137_c0_g1_i1.p1 TRINITY_DN8137_c0_g1~~TRINITY_DN8137_c0_g1_i1.p1  ORF type:complete len:237 (+),score=78.88 TRINITY_DN8137_c0_g1_i1:92-712(+)